MISRLFIVLFVLGPALLWLLLLLISMLLRMYGCTIWAKGPEQCIVLGTDIGAQIYPLWGLGYSLIPAVVWIPIALLIVGLLRFLNRIDLD